MDDEFVIRLARTRSDFDACLDLQRTVGGVPDLEAVSPAQLIAAVHAGGLVHLAEGGGRDVVGFAYAYPALRGGVPHLQSEMLAVRPDLQARGLGARLKWAQRAEALRRGITLLTWTFDPLQARHAQLTLRRLGATASQFFPDFFGRTAATLHHGLPTDRLLARWELKAPNVEECEKAPEPPRSVDPPPFARVNDVKWQAGWPVSSPPVLDLADDELLLEIPVPGRATDGRGLAHQGASGAAKLPRTRIPGRHLRADRGTRAAPAPVRPPEGLR
jgi:predicted GNAT superfamily acetyltransferase